jgi:hypothetical protein
VSENVATSLRSTLKSKSLAPVLRTWSPKTRSASPSMTAPVGQIHRLAPGSGMGSVIGWKQRPSCTTKPLLAMPRNPPIAPLGARVPMSVSPKSHSTRPSGSGTGKPPSLATQPPVPAANSPSKAAWYSGALAGGAATQWDAGESGTGGGPGAGGTALLTGWHASAIAPSATTRIKKKGRVLPCPRAGVKPGSGS